MKRENDKELILAIQEGDEQAFNALYEKYYKLVYFIAYELCKNDADAKDISQETFVQVKKSIATLHDVENFKPWLNRITINKCKNLFRSNRTVSFDMDDAFYQNNLVEERNYMLPEVNSHFKSDQNIFHNLIMKLPHIQREVLLLRFFENLSMKDMAYVLDIPEGTVKTRLLYGKDNLRKMINEYEKVHNIKLDFNADATITAAFAAGFAYLHIPKVLPFVKIKKQFSFGSNIIGTTIGKVAIVSAVVSTGGVGAAAIYHRTQQDKPPLAQSVIDTYEDTHALTYYFELMNWASCEQDLREKSIEEIQNMAQTYAKLKEGNSEYYKRLVQDKWTSIYEELLKNL